MTTKYPVDSTYHQCCNTIGRHTDRCPGLRPDFPVPAGATADPWDAVCLVDGTAMRSLTWSRHDTGTVGVAIDGFQHSDDGRIERGISLYDIKDRSLTAAQAVDLARALLKAATVLDKLDGNDTVQR
ncbi:hypothetical protein JDV09_15400 [Mycobacterium sp. Y57]|uniref:hypothetical protein n=1 Tax=Mycolicibacterium xanthum TaxID=2796469 RepID=UPI001C84C7E3|nr:hypothetical protein [Mycolicibacterium xanthum]MBX7433486.1 hypothetical protein [Mycolicibacterium xanthum]